jgi:lysozyme
MNQTTNQAGLQLIESFEGLRLNSYQDSVGVWTIGYGHTLGVKPGQTITQQQAQAFLQQDLGVAEAAVNRLGLTLTGNQFAALVSFTFNLGGGNLNKLMSQGLAAVPDRILLFDHAGGRVLPGLTRRRTAERALYLTPDVATPATPATPAVPG